MLYVFGMFVTYDFVLRSVLPLWFAAGYFRNGVCGRTICTLIGKYFDYSHVRVQTERDGTRAEIRFGLPAKRTGPFISAGVSVQSSTGFLGVRVGGERL